MRKTSILVLTVILLAFVSLAASAAPAFEKVLPEDTLAFVTLRNIPAMRERIKTYSIYDLWKEPSVQQFLEKPIARMKEELAKAEGESGVKLDEVWSLLHGQVALSVSLNPEKPEPEFVLLVDVGPDGEKAMKLVATVMDKVAEANGSIAGRRVEESHDGAQLVGVYPTEPNDAIMPQALFSYGVAGDVFLLGTPLSAVKRTATLLNNPSASSLAASTAYTSTVTKVSADSDLIVFVNIARIIGAVNMNAQGSPVPQFMGAFGLNSLVSAGLGVKLGQENSTSRFFLQNSGPAQGILKLLMPQPGPLYSGSDVPADAAQYISGRVDPTIIWNELEKILGTVMPQALAAINAQVGQLSEQLGQPIDIRRDVISVFGPRIALYTRYEKPYNIATSQKTLFMVEISSKAAFEQTLDKLRVIAPQLFMMMQPEDYLGHQVFSMAQQPGMPAPEGLPQPGFTATESQLILSNHVDALKAHLRTLGKGGASIADSIGFRAGLAQLPTDGRVMISYQDPSSQIALFLHSLKEGKLSQMLGMFRGDPDTNALLEAFDFSLLPEAAVITKHLSPTTGCAVVGPDGLLVISRTPARAAGK